MKSVRNAYVHLVTAAIQVEKALARVAKASEQASRLRTGALWGALGFGLSAGGVFAALAAISALVYAPFAVPTAGLCGLLIGVILSRDRTDRDNEQGIDLIETAWSMREQEMRQLTKAIKDARLNPSPRLDLLEQTLAGLEIATPQQLIHRYDLRDRRSDAVGAPVLPIAGPGEQRVLQAWTVPLPQLNDRTGDVP